MNIKPFNIEKFNELTCIYLIRNLKIASKLHEIDFQTELGILEYYLLRRDD